MVRLALAATAVAACYAPSAQPGAPCGPGGECPSGQECRAMVCVRLGTPHDAPDTPDLDAPVDGSQVTLDAPIDGPPYIPWGTPLELGTLETPGSAESNPSVSADKLTVVLDSNTAADDRDIYIATRTAIGDNFTGLGLIAEVNTAGFDDQSPELSADGKTLFFVSNRDGEFEVYVSTFTTTWSTPILRTDLSSAEDDSDVAISPDGLTAVVLRDDGANEIYLYTRATTDDMFAGATRLTTLEITTDIASPTITNDAQVIYFHAGDTRDIYVARRSGNGPFPTPLPVAELTDASIREAAPFVVQTDDYMIYERSSDIYETTR